MIWFFLGAGWIVVSFGVGAFGCWLFDRYKPKAKTEGSYGDLPKFEARLGSLESKVNLMTAFRKKEGPP